MNLKRTTPVFLNHLVDDSHRAKPLPHPTGTYPYRLNIREVLGDVSWFLKQRMSFHMVGDTGSFRHSAFQSRIASVLAQQANENPSTSERPAFLFHLGDVVYNHGEASEYPKQFFAPYEDYPAPIFAIVGNHDGDINPDSDLIYQSLDTFMDVFCDTYRRKIRFSGGSKRLSMIQPNVYWTLETPLARFIGLYANVTKHGIISAEQQEWFIEELKSADRYRPDQALIVCLHHAPYSADTNHGSSPAMIAFLENAYKEADVRPDIVFSGHVHNYQRFTKIYEDGSSVPYVVAGAGGYADLHPIATISDPRVSPLDIDVHKVRMENFCDDRFGFLKVSIEKDREDLLLIGEYYTMGPDILMQHPQEAVLFERFFVPIRNRAPSFADTATIR